MNHRFEYSQIADLRKNLAITGHTTIQLMSGSMSPVLKTGDTATIEPVAIDDLVMRDIIVFWSDDKLICHVVWAHSTMRSASGERMIVTRGLASLHFDYPVRESEIIGRVKSHRIGALAFLWYQILNKFRLKR